MSGAASRKLSTQAVKQFEKSAGSSAFITSFSVSWEGMPRAKGSMVRRNVSFSRPQRRTSTKSSAAAMVAHRTRSMISGSG
jgi:hypothetical protein